MYVCVEHPSQQQCRHHAKAKAKAKPKAKPKPKATAKAKAKAKAKSTEMPRPIHDLMNAKLVDYLL